MTTTEEYFERAGLGDRLGFGTASAIIGVDLQLGFTDPDHPLGASLPGVIEATNRITAAGREHDVPVVFTILSFPHRAGVGLLGEKASAVADLTPERRWTDLDPALEVADDDYILDTKRHQSAFFGTELNQLLRNLGVDTVIVTGCSTSGCVRATVTDANALGFRPIIPRTAVGDRSTDQHEANLVDLEAKLADVVSVEEVLEHLTDRNER